MFIAALFIVAQPWKQPKYPTLGKWLSQLGTAAQRNSTQPFKLLTMTQASSGTCHIPR